MAELDFGTGDPHRGSECRPCVKRVRCGVVDLGGVLERARRGVPPIGAVKSDARAGGWWWWVVHRGRWNQLGILPVVWIGLFVCSRGDVWRCALGAANEG